MKILVVIPPDQFRDEELAEPLAAFQTAGIPYDIASTRKGECKGMLGARATASLSLEEVDPGDYAGIVIVGGSGSPAHLWNHEMLIQLVKYFYRNRKVVGAICLSPVVLAHAGILKGKTATCYMSPESKREMLKEGVKLSDKPVIVDGTLVTANGPAAAREFAAALIRQLK